MIKTQETDKSGILFHPRSEEDLMRSMIALSNALKYVKDLPQVTIDLLELPTHILRANIILLRLVQPESNKLSIEDLSKSLSPEFRFIPERVSIVGNLRGKYEKEATVFSLECDSFLFSKKNGAVDLEKAYARLASELEKMIGPFVDHLSKTFPHSPSKEAWVRTPQKLQCLRLQLPRAAQSLNPHAASDRTSGIVTRMLYEGLCRVNPEGHIEPALAQEITVSQDKKTYTFHLKETFWSNGTPLTAYDFEYAWKKILQPQYHSPYSFLFFSILNAECVKKGDKEMGELGISAENERKLVVHLENPAPYFLELTASWLFFPLSQQMDQKHPGWAHHSGATHVCNGPYKLDLWRSNDDLQLLKNPLYWDAPRVKLDKIQISIISEEKKALELFYKGELDWVGDPLSKLPPQEFNSLKKRGLLQVDHDRAGLFWLQLNTEKPPFNNVKMRHAFACGANREKIIQHSFGGNGAPAFGFASSKDQAFQPQFKDGDRKKALALFEEGLKELGMTRKDLSPLTITHSEIEEHILISRALGEQWQELFGIKIRFKKLIWNTYFDALHQNDFVIGGLVWYPRYTDPIYFYDLFVRRSYALRVSNWDDPAYRKIVEKAKMEESPEEKRKLLFNAEKMLVETMQAIPLLYIDFFYVKHPSLQGFIPATPNQIDFRTAEVAS